MREEEYIKSQLDGLAEKFEGVSFTYMRHFRSNTHIIDVSPSESLELDEFLDSEAAFVLEFGEEFPDQGLLFVSNDPLVPVANVIHSVKKITKINQVRVTYEILGELSKPVMPQSRLYTPIDIVELFTNLQLDLNTSQKRETTSVATISDTYTGESYFALAA